MTLTEAEQQRIALIRNYVSDGCQCFGCVEARWLLSLIQRITQPEA